MPKKDRPAPIDPDAVICGHCHYFQPDPDEPPHGYCVVTPPTPMVDDDGVFSADPPVSFERAGCRHFKRKLNA